MIKEIKNHSGYVASDQGLIFRKTKDGLRGIKAINHWKVSGCTTR